MTEKLNKIVLRNIFIPFIVSVIVTIWYFLTDFPWSYLIPVFVGPIFSSVYEFNKNYLISLTPTDTGSSTIELVYYNYLDKIKTETFNKTDITKIKRSKNKIQLELPNYRELKLHLLDESKETLGNTIYIYSK